MEREEREKREEEEDDDDDNEEEEQEQYLSLMPRERIKSGTFDILPLLQEVGVTHTKE